MVAAAERSGGDRRGEAAGKGGGGRTGRRRHGLRGAGGRSAQYSSEHFAVVSLVSFDGCEDGALMIRFVVVEVWSMKGSRVNVSSK